MKSVFNEHIRGIESVEGNTKQYFKDRFIKEVAIQNEKIQMAVIEMLDERIKSLEERLD